MTFDEAFDRLIGHEGGLLFFVATSWFKQVAFWHPSFYSSVNRTERYSENFASVSKQKFFAAKSNISVRPSIVCLLSSRSPSAIFFAVISVVINSVKSIAFWPSPHICKKVFKIFPPLAVRDPSSSVVRPFRAVLVIASALHSGPNPVFSSPQPNRLSMLRCFGFGEFTTKTPAANYKPAPEGVQSRYADHATVAHIVPVAVFTVSMA